MGASTFAARLVGPTSAVALVCGALLWAACGGTVPLAGADAGVNAPTYDAGPPDTGPAPADCNLGEGGVAPQGKLLVGSPSAQVLGVTNDGYAIYNDRHLGKVYAVPIAGGAPEQIGPAWDSGSTVISILGGVVLYWTGIPSFAQTPRLGQLVVWTASGHARVLSNNAIAGIFAVSDDGKLVVYTENSTANIPDGGTSGTGAVDIVVSAPDGTGKITLATKVVWSSECVPNVAFVGTRAVVASCAAAKLPQPAATIRAYAGPSFTAPVVLNNQPAYTFFGHDSARLIYYTSGFVLNVQSITGSPLPLMANVYNAFLSHDGTFVVIHNANGAIYRSPTSSPAVSFISAGYINVQALSPDDKWLIVNKAVDPDLGLYDLHLLSTAPNSTPTTLVAKPTSAFLNDWFTADMSRVIFGANNKVAPVGFYGDFAAVPLSAPATPALTVTTTAWSGYATKGTKVVYNDGYDLVFPSLPTSDIQVVDLASPTARTKLVSHADANFYVNADRTKAIYSWTYCADQRSGLYVVDLP